MNKYFTILYIGAIVLTIASLWKIFEKAGQPGWAVFIPFYNIIILLRIVEKPAWYLVLLLIPVVNIVVGVYLAYLLAKSFEQDILFAIGLVFLPFIFYPILGFGDAPYVGPEGDYFPEEEYPEDDTSEE